MKKLKYISLIVLSLIFSNGHSAGRVLEVGDPFVSQLPSEKTHENIEASYERPALRDAPPGGGPGLGEIIVPIGDVEFGFLVVMGLAYSVFIFVKKNSKKKI